MAEASARKILFVDRDGTLIAEPPDFQVDSVEKFALVPGVIPALLSLRDAGWRFVMITNQDGLGTKSYPRRKWETVQTLLMGVLESQGIRFDAVLVCPHRDGDACECRKPRLGLLKAYLADPGWDRSRSAVIGDRETDLLLARNMGIRGVRMGTWPRIARSLLDGRRGARAERTTKETAIKVEVALDGDGSSRIATGIGYFDHMLEQLAKHGGFDLRLSVKGDLHIDEHHTVEDVGLALGGALRKALGDKVGIGRYGFTLPMDESLASAAVDLSGRAYFKFDGKFPRESVGGLPTELVPHFFRSLSDALGATLHLRVRGENAHHMVEACFKAVGRALRPALKLGGGGLPSTKGSL
ncbi:MAG TPA: bifunctional histidinol-phosphatase/imidazoleglycerol-phosphate dehydratase HisB [Elusimicrobiota bacterium]|nr:bifunctional histidinol-phosphatase/imidazoleglycerol-phosphate dehydratase HisB [Elusimicrobiota bacterium]